EVAGLARSLNRMAETLRRRLDDEREERTRLQAVLSDYGRLAARVAGGDLTARVEPAGDGELAELGRNLNRMTADLARQVAHLRQATDEARRERERVDRILDSIADGFVAVDREWRFVYINRRAAEVTALMGRPAERLLGRVLWDEFPELCGSRAEEEYRRAMRDGVTTQFQFRDPAVDRWYEVRAYPSADGLSIYFTDVTERRRAEEQLARFKIIADRATEAYLLCDSETRIVYANRVAAERLGYSVDELLTLSASVIDPLYSRELVAELVARSRRGDTPTPFESLHRRRDGSTFPVETSLTVVELDGEPHLFAAARDITLRKRTEQQLREETEALETVNRVSRVLSAELDLQKLVQELTDAATRLTGAAFGAFFYNIVDERGERYMLYTLSGVPAERFAGFPMPRNTGLFGPTFRGQAVVRLDDVRQDPRYGQNPPYHGLPPGHLPVVSYLAVPVISRSGEVLGGLFFGHPAAGRFTERHERIVTALAAQAAVAMDNARLYQTEQRARAQAEAASRSKDEFLAMLSHELRTPLTAVLGWAVMLRARPVDEAVRERALAAIERNARAQSQLIEDLLDISRIVSGKLRLDTRPVNLAVVVEAALEVVQPATHAKGVEITADLTPVALVGDPQRLQQVVWNLLSNAVKFTPAGGRVEVRLGSEGEQAELVVRDTGQGIPADALPHIFDRFRQADSTTTRRHGGLGLGLALVKHLVELHGGTVT
ncbi:MAG TPA: ATP-binding protein, partial [Candidatus Binatia bacterium]|nr:ATP-binding protein [Candidatus Binatia bacterium]